MSLPSFTGWKMTWAPSIGFLLKPLMTITSMCDVSGGALYLRPRLSGAGLSESCARRPSGQKVVRIARHSETEINEERRREVRTSTRSFYAKFVLERYPRAVHYKVGNAD